VASTSSTATAKPRWRRAAPAVVTQRILGVAAAGALGIDAYVHLRDAGFYEGKVALVTGVGTNIGAAARLLAKRSTAVTRVGRVRRAEPRGEQRRDPRWGLSPTA
jgi:hypothetical protein